LSKRIKAKTRISFRNCVYDTPVRNKKVIEKRLYHLSANGKRRFFCEKVASIHQKKKKYSQDDKEALINKIYSLFPLGSANKQK